MKAFQVSSFKFQEAGYVVTHKSEIENRKSKILLTPDSRLLTPC
jgi:hypothetical protein